jgi:hypothetical protein
MIFESDAKILSKRHQTFKSITGRTVRQKALKSMTGENQSKSAKKVSHTPAGIQFGIQRAARSFRAIIFCGCHGSLFFSPEAIEN